MKLKTVIVLCSIVFAGTAFSADLVTDPMAGVASYDIDIDGAVVTGIAAESDGSLRYNVDSLVAGPHVFKVRPTGEGGWPADWSAPLSETKPASATGLRIAP